jgi:monofunctional glycosyltransferase
MTTENTGDDLTQPGGSPKRGIVGRLFGWTLNHKWWTFFIAVGFFFFCELLTIPYFSIARLKEENPAETALMRQRIGEAEQDGRKLKIIHRWIPFSHISKDLIDAVIVAEDGTFYSHGGVDWFEVRESIEKNIDEGRAARGASTITQQLAKNLFLSTSKDPIRKFKELIITLLLEHQLGKKRILELYLNVIEWGRGIFGVEAAARTYFGKSASELTLDEATRLAAVIPSPLRHSPNTDSRYVLRRKDIVLRRMEARNFVNKPEEEDSSNSLDQIQSTATPGEVAPVDSSDIEEGEHNGF